MNGVLVFNENSSRTKESLKTPLAPGFQQSPAVLTQCMNRTRKEVNRMVDLSNRAIEQIFFEQMKTLTLKTPARPSWAAASR